MTRERLQSSVNNIMLLFIYFIGMGRSPDKITFMPLTFTLNHNVNYQGLCSLFPLRLVSSFIFAILPSRRSFSHSFGVHPCHLRVVSLYRTRLYHEKTFISKPKPPVTVYVILKHTVSHVFRTFGRGRPTTVSNSLLIISYMTYVVG
jgi:hypothetical protein